MGKSKDKPNAKTATDQKLSGKQYEEELKRSSFSFRSGFGAKKRKFVSFSRDVTALERAA